MRLFTVAERRARLDGQEHGGRVGGVQRDDGAGRGRRVGGLPPVAGQQVPRGQSSPPFLDSHASHGFSLAFAERLPAGFESPAQLFDRLRPDPVQLQEVGLALAAHLVEPAQAGLQ